MIDFTYIDIEENPVTDYSNPEKILLKKERLNSISTEAKTILKLIIDAPQELLGLSKIKTKKEISVQDLQAFAEKKMGKSIRQGRKIIAELRELAHGC